MTRADDLYKDAVEKIAIEGVWDKDSSSLVRTVYADGKRAYSKGIFGEQFTFKEGEVPILTSKKVFWKTALKEMMLFWQHQTVQEKDFKKYNVKVWDEWFKDGNLGKSYAYQWETTHSDEDTVYIDSLYSYEDIIKMVKNPVTSEKDGSLIGIDSIIGIDSETGEEIELIAKYVDIGHEVTKVYQRDYFISEDGSVYIHDEKSDTYLEVTSYMLDGSTYVDYSEYHSELKESDFREVRSIWVSLMKDDDVILSDRWKVFDYFFRDVYYVPQYFIARENNFKNWYLCTDYYDVLHSINKKSKKILSRETATWLSYKARYEILPNFRTTKKLPKISENQVITLLRTMSNFPNSRRLMTSFWNFDEIKDKVLQECAWSTDWRIRNGVLDLILIQRSGDIALNDSSSAFNK